MTAVWFLTGLGAVVCVFLSDLIQNDTDPCLLLQDHHYVHLNLMFCSEKGCSSEIDSNLMKSAVLRGREHRCCSTGWNQGFNDLHWLDFTCPHWQRTETGINRTNNSARWRNADLSTREPHATQWHNLLKELHYEHKLMERTHSSMTQRDIINVHGQKHKRASRTVHI